MYLDHSYVREQFADSTNLTTLGEYEVSNIRYSFIGANNITTTLFVNNLMDSIYVTNQRDFTFGFGGIGYDYGRQRAWNKRSVQPKLRETLLPLECYTRFCLVSKIGCKAKYDS